MGTSSQSHSRSRNHREEAPFVEKWIRPVVVGLIVGTLCCLAVLVAFALIMAAVDMPQMAVTPMAVFAAAAGAFFAGLACARKSGSNGLIYGAVCGIALYAVVMLAGFIVLSDIRGVYALAKLLIMTGIGGIGGIVGVNKK